MGKKKSTPKPEIDADAIIDEIEQEAKAQAKAIQDEARKKFRLIDQLQDETTVVFRTELVSIFLDLPAVDAYQQQELKVLAARARHGNATARTPLGEPEPPRDELDAEEKRLAELREKMLQGERVFEIRGYPPIAIKAAREAARKKFGHPIPEKVLEEAQEYMDDQRRAAAIVRIIDPVAQAEDNLAVYVNDKGKKVRPRETIMATLRRTIPAAAYEYLVSRIEEVTLAENIAREAVDDPGF